MYLSWKMIISCFIFIHKYILNFSIQFENHGTPLFQDHNFAIAEIMRLKNTKIIIRKFADTSRTRDFTACYTILRQTLRYPKKISIGLSGDTLMSKILQSKCDKQLTDHIPPTYH